MHSRCPGKLLELRWSFSQGLSMKWAAKGEVGTGKEGLKPMQRRGRHEVKVGAICPEVLSVRGPWWGNRG